MATATATRVDISQEQSLALMKNSVRASVGEICWLRNLFPHDLFRTCKFGSTNVRALVAKEPSTQAVVNEDAHKLTTLMEAALEAVERKYLRSIVVGIYSAEADPKLRTLLESYVFHFKYPTGDDVEAVLETDSESFTLPRVREDAMVMIRRLIRLMETLKPLPYKKVLTFKLFYYDDATPSDYNPPHYVDSTYDVHPFFAAPPFKVAVGAVGSKFHSLTVKVAFAETEASASQLMIPDSQVEAPVAVSMVPSADVPAPAEPVGAGVEEAQASEPDYSHLQPGVDRNVYIIARQLVISEQIFTLKGLLSALRDYADDRYARGAIDVTNEHARKILKCLEVEGILVGKSGNRYDIAEAYKSDAPAARKPVVTPPKASAPTVSMGEREDALFKARALRAKAICLIAGHKSATGSPATHITIAKLSELLHCDEGIARMLIQKVAEKGVLGSGSGPGFELLRSAPAFLTAWRASVEALRLANLWTAELAACADLPWEITGKKRERPAKVSRPYESDSEDPSIASLKQAAREGPVPVSSAAAPRAMQNFPWAKDNSMWMKQSPTGKKGKASPWP